MQSFRCNLGKNKGTWVGERHRSFGDTRRKTFPVEVGYWLESETFQSQGAFWLGKRDTVTKAQIWLSAQ